MMAGWEDERRGEVGMRGRGLGLRDEVDSIMKRLRIPWRERQWEVRSDRGRKGGRARNR